VKCPQWKRINAERWRIFEGPTKPELTEAQKTLAKKRRELGRVIERLGLPGLSPGIARELRKMPTFLSSRLPNWKCKGRSSSDVCAYNQATGFLRFVFAIPHQGQYRTGIRSVPITGAPDQSCCGRRLRPPHTVADQPGHIFAVGAELVSLGPLVAALFPNRVLLWVGHVVAHAMIRRQMLGLRGAANASSIASMSAASASGSTKSIMLLSMTGATREPSSVIVHGRQTGRLRYFTGIVCLAEHLWKDDGRPGRVRTCDLTVICRSLYQLSYGPRKTVIAV
jgi:hypothetical protein